MLAGTANATTTVGPFKPEPGKPVMLELSGTWTGSATVKRSSDGGTTKLPLTVAGSPWAAFTGNACEAVWEEVDRDASLYLEIVLSSGSLTYRMSQ